jgi:hypothetical protein
MVKLDSADRNQMQKYTNTLELDGDNRLLNNGFKFKEAARNPNEKLTNGELYSKIAKCGKQIEKSPNSSLADIDMIILTDELHRKIELNPNLSKSLPKDVQTILEKRCSNLESRIQEISEGRRDVDIVGVSGDVAKWKCEEIEKICKILNKKLPTEPFVTTAKIFLDATFKQLQYASSNSPNPSNPAHLAKFHAADVTTMLAKVGITLRPFGVQTLAEWGQAADKIIQQNRK